jgi:RimJ/RimL family protein N-acetyltransferase
VIRYIGDGTPWSSERSRRFVERQIELFEQRRYCLWQLRPKSGGALIGFCGLQPLPETDEIEVGWWLMRDCWGRGLATEAARMALRDGFERVGLQRIVAIVQPANAASIGIMRKLGMRCEGAVARASACRGELQFAVLSSQIKHPAEFQPGAKPSWP